MVLAARQWLHAIDVRRVLAAGAARVDGKVGDGSELQRRVTRISALILLSIVAAFAIAGAAFYWRLSLGPVSLNFMTGAIQSQINKNLTGMTVAVEDAVIERAAGSRIP